MPVTMQPATMRLCASVVAGTAAFAAGYALAYARAQRNKRRHHRGWVDAIGFEAYRDELAVAVDLAVQCGDNMLQTLGAVATMKEAAGDISGESIDPVTATDIENERLCFETLSKAFPSHVVVGEETASSSGTLPIRSNKHTWIVDPIDGTQNFCHGAPLSVVSIGLQVDGTPAMGVVYDPFRDEMYVGVAAEGAYMNGTRMRSDGCKSLAKAIVCTDVGYERSPGGIKNISSTIAALLKENTFAVRIVGSTCLQVVWVACGRVSAFYSGLGQRDCPKPWDWCAVSAIAKACGVTCLRLDSDEPFSVETPSTVWGSTPELAHQLRGMIRTACPSLSARDER